MVQKPRLKQDAFERAGMLSEVNGGLTGVSPDKRLFHKSLKGMNYLNAITFNRVMQADISPAD